jgi:RimJ/RimL family protein N-acetyltransferase
MSILRTEVPGEVTGSWADKLAFRARLNDGRRVLVRPLVPADRARLLAGLSQLSPRSRFLRFHAHVGGMSESRLRYFSDVDFRRHVAWGALALDEPDAPGVGVARFVRDRCQQGSAEFAVTIVDQWQGVGLGSLLLRTLMASAAQRGIERLVAPVLRENEAGLRLIERFGGRRVRIEGDTVDMVLPIRRPLLASRPMIPGVLPAPGGST